MTHKNEENLSFEMHARCFLLRDEDLSCSLDVLYGDIGISKLQLLIKKNINFTAAVNFFQFLVIKTVGLDPDPYPDPH
jgi:hypothetical protein